MNLTLLPDITDNNVIEMHQALSLSLHEEL